jgi:hypothetical protein
MAPLAGVSRATERQAGDLKAQIAGEIYIARERLDADEELPRASSTRSGSPAKHRGNTRPTLACEFRAMSPTLPI